MLIENMKTRDTAVLLALLIAAVVPSITPRSDAWAEELNFKYVGGPEYESTPSGFRVKAATADLAHIFALIAQGWGDSIVEVEITEMLNALPGSMAGIEFATRLLPDRNFVGIYVRDGTVVVAGKDPLYAEPWEEVTPLGSNPIPVYLRLERTASLIIGSYRFGSSGEWTEVYNSLTSQGISYYVFLATTSGNDNRAVEVSFGDPQHTGGPFPPDTLGRTIGDERWAFYEYDAVNDSHFLDASGAGRMDIWDDYDRFAFAYKTVEGDFDAIAYISEFNATHPWAKAGIMVRETLDGNSRNVAQLYSSANGSILQMRASPSASPSEGLAFTPDVAAPGYTKIERRGDIIRGFISPDGDNWSHQGDANLDGLPSPVAVGIATSSNWDGDADATVDWFEITEIGGGGQPPTNQPPIAVAGATEETIVWETSSDPDVGPLRWADPIVLDGTSSYDPDGTIVAYNWQLVESPSEGRPTIENASSKTATLLLDYPGEYIVRLTVTDDEGYTNTDTVTITAGTGYRADLIEEELYAFPIKDADRGNRKLEWAVVGTQNVVADEINGDTVTLTIDIGGVASPLDFRSRIEDVASSDGWGGDGTDDFVVTTPTVQFTDISPYEPVMLFWDGETSDGIPIRGQADLYVVEPKDPTSDTRWIPSWLLLGPFPSYPPSINDNSIAAWTWGAESEDSIEMFPGFRLWNGEGDDFKEVIVGNATSSTLDFSHHFGPTDNAMAYAVAWVRVTRNQPQTVDIVTASDDGIQTLVDDTPVWTNDTARDSGSEGEIQDRVTVTLAPGLHKIMVKVSNFQHEWKFRMGFENPDGGPLSKHVHILSADALADRTPGPPSDIFVEGGTNGWGFFQNYLVLGPYESPGGGDPLSAQMDFDYLDNGSVNETLVPYDGMTVAPSPSAVLHDLLPVTSVSTQGGDLELNDWFWPLLGYDPDDMMAYVWAFVENATGGDVVAYVELASDDGIVLLHNGIEVFRNSVLRWYGNAGEVQNGIPIDLVPGPNELMIKLFEGTGGWGMRLRLTVGGVPVVSL